MSHPQATSLAAANRLAIKAMAGNAHPAGEDLVAATTDAKTGTRHFFWVSQSKDRLECVEAEVRDDGATLVLVMDRPDSSSGMKGSLDRFLSALQSFLSQPFLLPTTVPSVSPAGFRALDALERMGDGSEVALRIKEELDARHLDRAE